MILEKKRPSGIWQTSIQGGRYMSYIDVLNKAEDQVTPGMSAVAPSPATATMLTSALPFLS